MPTTTKSVYFYLSGVAAFALTVPVVDIPGMEAAAASGSWWSPSNSSGDHINMATVVRYTIVS
jgi:hypothetical protein